jgi:hypothetical protein
MTNPVFKLGGWYESKNKVRKYFGEYWKGILSSSYKTAIIFNYRGARRVHYGDKLDYKNGRILYIGEGKSGDQLLNSRNAALIEAKESQTPVDVFLDCGDIFKPKRLLYSGRWQIDRYQYSTLSRSEPRKVYKFSLSPSSPKIVEFLRFSFSALGRHAAFEKDLASFARARTRMYSRHSNIMRSRDNISGEIGEYFAIKAFNKQNPDQHLIRLTGAHRDIDAIQIGNGKRVAIKTISKIPSSTSNIWSRNLQDAVDLFVICLIDQQTLRPILVVSIATGRALQFVRKDRYQGSHKLHVSVEFLQKATFLLGEQADWVN